MNIPDEVQKAADDLYWDRGKQYGGFGCAEEAYEYIAEWARKEALREAADAVHDKRLYDDTGHPEDSGYMDAIGEALEAIRALAEGDN